MSSKKLKIGLLALLVMLSAFAAISLRTLPVGAYIAPGNVLANVIVSNSCFTSVSPALPSFNALAPATSESTNLLVTDTDFGGNAAATIWILGSSWSSGSNTFPVGNTLWAASAQASYTGTALTASFASTGVTVAAPTVGASTQTGNIFFGIGVPAGTPNGAYSESVTFNSVCTGGGTTQAVTFNVIVQGVCYISISPNSINFGTLVPTATYNTIFQVSDNDIGGNAAANILIDGTTWQGPGTNTIPVGNTLYNPSSVAAYVGNALSLSLSPSGIFVPAPTNTVPTATANVFFGLGVPGGTAAGTYTQNILLENSC